MARKPNTLLRVLVPAVLILAGIGVAIAVGINTVRQGNTPVDESIADTEANEPAAPEQAAAEPPATEPAAVPSADPADDAQTEQAEAPSLAPAGAPAEEPDQQDAGATAQQTAQAVSPAELRVRPQPAPNPDAPPITLGGQASDKVIIEFSTRGAGIASLRLTEHAAELGSDEGVELQAEQFDGAWAVPFAALQLIIEGDGEPQRLVIAGTEAWRADPDQPGHFIAEIEDAQGNLAISIERTYTLDGSYDLRLEQTITNHAASSINARFLHAGPVDLPVPTTTYGGDKRRARFGYLLKPEAQGSDTTVSADSRLTARAQLLGKRDKETGRFPPTANIWPVKWSTTKEHRLSWFAFTGRYFAVAVHPEIDPADPGAGGKNYLFSTVEDVQRYVLNPGAKKKRDTVILSAVQSPRLIIPAGGSVDLTRRIYAGPLSNAELGDPVSGALSLQELIVYNFGAGCGSICTFAWLTHVLIWVLRGLHTLSFDWAVSIVLLVVVVRACLHPITRFAQTRLAVFGAQMQGVGPKMKKLQEKYKALDSDTADVKLAKQRKLQSEIGTLFREEGVNPAGVLGCLPMLLQSPVWIALYATLFFAFELRHSAGFYGVFQTISAGHWSFLADLSQPDAALPLPFSFGIPFLSGLGGKISSINLLPILMGVLFYIQQKYMTPPTANTMSPEQEAQMKMMKVMTVVMFPLFMYTAPAGLSIYFLTNSSLAIFEIRWIRAQAKAKGLLDPDKIKQRKAEKRAAKAGSGGGFLARLRQMAEEQQQLRAQGGQAGPGKRRVANTAPGKRDEPPRKYKKRR